MPEFDLDAALAKAPNEGHYDVDLRWSAWSCDPDDWETCAPEAWAAIQGLQPNEEVNISSASCKEVRYARIIISRAGNGTWCADGQVEEQWDEATACLSMFHLPDEAYDFFVDILPYASDMPGVYYRVHETADTLEHLMAAVDRAEVSLMARSRLAWTAVENVAKGWLKANTPKKRKRRTRPV